jgi:hypothetical protein
MTEERLVLAELLEKARNRSSSRRFVSSGFFSGLNSFREV